ncbi:APC family permease [Saccharibacter floricola]|uniref:Amino acid transporter n=1 Tax=Saccharibacter floricola DSM 15669 TaxID=1123227 RepID=A0ABQ0P0K2_9PROT|nr:amino acid permease [Saccharibacter floricola]GBQ07821.1 amino acid transporter [Saccharibacter floricola DSM 15669]
MTTSFWRIKPITADTKPTTGLKPVMGPWQLMALGIGVTVGAGLFSLTGVAAGQHAGPAVVLSFIIAAIACGFAGLCYAELAGMLPVAGSAYSYAYSSMGELVAWIIGWDLILEYTVAAAAVASSWSGYFSSLLRGWGLYIDPRLLAPPMTPVTLSDGQVVHAWFNAPSVFILFIVTALLMRGTSESSTVNAIIVAIKLLIVAIVTIVCLPHIHATNFQPFVPHNTGHFGHFGFSGIMQAASMIFFAYIGFDTVSTAAQDSRNPQRDLPISLIGSLLICAVIYVVFSSVLVGVVNYKDLAHDPNPVATVMDSIHMPALSAFVKLGIALGYMSVIYGMMLGQSRVSLALAHDGLLPPCFAKLNARCKTPWTSHIITALASSILAACLPIGILGAMTSIGTLLAFVIVSVGVMILRYKAPNAPRRFRVPGGNILIPSLGALACLIVMLSMDGLTWGRLVIWLLIGGVVYGLYGRHHSLLKNNTPH